jgi:hypothetical protein
MNQARKNLHWIVIATLLMFSITFVRVGTASPEIKIAVDPPQVKDLDPGSTFTVDIIVTGIVINEYSGLYAWDFELEFNSKILNVVNATEGPFLKTVFNETTWGENLAPPKIDNDAGTITQGNTHLPIYPMPTSGATGNGTLATVTFEVVSRGVTELHFKLSELYTFEPPNWSMKMEHTAVDGFFSNGTGTELSLGLIAAIIIGVIICCSGAFFYIRRRRA